MCVIGDPGVGKTTFFDYLVNHIPTAIKHSDTTVDIIQQIEGEKIKVPFKIRPQHEILLSLFVFCVADISGLSRFEPSLERCPFAL